MNNSHGKVLAMKVFGTPRHIIPFYEADDSGTGTDPIPGSKTKPAHRIFYFQAYAILKYLSGPNLIKMSERYMTNLGRNFNNNQSIQTEWVDLPDLYAFLQVETFRAVV